MNKNQQYKLELLMKDYWSNNDIKEYFNVSISVAKRIKVDYSKSTGLTIVQRNVKVEKILKHLGLDFNKEMEILSITTKCLYMIKEAKNE